MQRFYESLMGNMPALERPLNVVNPSAFLSALSETNNMPD